MSYSTFAEFIADYSEENSQHIQCQCTNDEQARFIDPRAEFRLAIIQYILANKAQCPEILLRDLFQFETQHCSHSWSAPAELSGLGAMLLNKCGSKYVEEFLIGLNSTFDTQMAIGTVSIPQDLAKKLTDYLELKIQSEPNSNQELIKFGIEYFNKLG